MAKILIASNMHWVTFKNWHGKFLEGSLARLRLVPIGMHRCWWAKLLVGSPLMHPMPFVISFLQSHSICSKQNLLWIRTQTWLDFRYNHFWGLSSKAFLHLEQQKEPHFRLIFFSIRSNCLMTIPFILWLIKSGDCQSTVNWKITHFKILFLFIFV